MVLLLIDTYLSTLKCLMTYLVVLKFFTDTKGNNFKPTTGRFMIPVHCTSPNQYQSTWLIMMSHVDWSYKFQAHVNKNLVWDNNTQGQIMQPNFIWKMWQSQRHNFRWWLPLPKSFVSLLPKTNKNCFEESSTDGRTTGQPDGRTNCFQYIPSQLLCSVCVRACVCLCVC